MIIAGKGVVINPADTHSQVVYTWLGKMRWLPHIGSPHYVLGFRNDHVIAVAIREGNERIGDRVYIHKSNLAVCCDPHDEFTAIQEIKSRYHRRRASLDIEASKSIRTLIPEVAKVIAVERKRSRESIYYVQPKNNITT